MDFDNPPADPVAEFKRWLGEAEGLGLRNPNAMTLATVDRDGRPTARIVLLKGFDERGAVFYTNRESRKGRAIEAGSAASLVFYWDALQRQVVIEGAVSRIDDAESDAYFATRPRGAQIGAWASDQSRAAGSRAELDRRVLETINRFGTGPIPRPPHWGGYRVRLDRVEFWAGRDDRLHDRVEYRKEPDGKWATRRLFP